ncbi:MAG: hypothetical protein ABIK89_07450 [Planctomycetota bacterium]
MGFLSRLFGRSANAAAEPRTVAPPQPFQLPWCCQGSTEGLELNNPRVLISDFEGITASNVATIRDACRRAGSPLVVVTPGVDASFLQLLSEGDLVAIKATDLPGQPVDNLLADLAVITGGNDLRTELGFGLAFPESLSKMAEHGIHVPDFSWESLTLDSLARLIRIVVSREGVEFYCAEQLVPQRDVQARMARILREPSTAGREERLRRLYTADERLRRLCTVTGSLPDKAKTLGSLHTDFSTEYALGLASPYFATDANTMECRLEDAYVAVFGEPLNDLELLVRLLGRIAAAGRPLLILARSVSDEVLAICVVNKLRGIIQGAVAISRTPSQDPRAMLAEIAGRTGAQVITQTEARRVQGQGFLGRAATVRATRDGMALTPT